VLVNRYNNGLGPSMLQFADKRDMYEKIQNSDHRTKIIEQYRDGGAIVVATSATLQGGTALIRGSYMHPNGWGSDRKNLFLIVGGAIPGIMAKIALNQYESTEEINPGNGYCDIVYSYWEDTDEGRKWFSEKLRFTARLEELSEFSAHANVDELLSFRRNINTENFIVTHIGGHAGHAVSADRAQEYINNVFMCGVSNFKTKGASIGRRGDVIILDGKTKANIELEADKKTLIMDTETYNMLRIKCIKDKGDYGHVAACNVIRRLISEDDKKIASS
jgi:Cft2 family RNA processing exonuclease